MTDKEARHLYVHLIAARTVWIRQRHDGQWEAINWEGNVVAFSKYRASCEHEVVRLAGNSLNNIHATAVVVDPDEEAKGNEEVLVKKYHIVFTDSEKDKRLLDASVKALASEVMVTRFGHTIEYDDSTGKTTLRWWRIPTGGFDAK
jgi:hypothetical protein